MGIIWDNSETAQAAVAAYFARHLEAPRRNRHGDAKAWAMMKIRLEELQGGSDYWKAHELLCGAMRYLEWWMGR